MRIRLFILSTAVLLPSVLSAEVFKGNPSRVAGSVMMIRWETADETEAVKFEVYRREYRSGGLGPAELIGEVPARGANNSVYLVEDGGIFKVADRVLEYEIRAVNRHGGVVEIVKMTTVLSGGLTTTAERTWGSIKAMFR
ncbi:MAG TPA: hypothetical protein VGA55_05950 [Bacteroidota bacterium]